MKKWLEKRQYIVLSIFLIGCIMAMNGCAIVDRRPHPMRRKKVVVAKTPSATLVYVKEAPPKIIIEKRPPRPHKSAVWIDGYWNWNGAKYVWVNGRWDLNPKGKVWIPGKWMKTSHGWLWEPGHWK